MFAVQHFEPTHAEAPAITRIVSHLPVCKPEQASNCRVIGSAITLASFHADHGTYFVVVKHSPGHRTVKRAEFYRD